MHAIIPAVSRFTDFVVTAKPLPAAGLVIALLALTSCPARDEEKQTNGNEAEITVFVGRNVAAPVEDAVRSYELKTKIHVLVCADDADRLAQRVLQGDHCDIFIPDTADAIDKLIAAGKAVEDNVKPIFIERLAVLTTRGEGAPTELAGQNAGEFLRGARPLAIVAPPRGKKGGGGAGPGAGAG